MIKKKFAEKICLPFCEFYREGEKEDMYCQGGYICYNLLKENKLTAKGLKKVSPAGFAPEKNNQVLYSLVCKDCPFLTDGCDFRSKESPPDSVPCGGYIFLSNAIDCSVLTINTIKEVCSG